MDRISIRHRLYLQKLWNIVCKSTVRNIVTVRNFEVMCNKPNVTLYKMWASLLIRPFKTDEADSADYSNL